MNDVPGSRLRPLRTTMTGTLAVAVVAATLLLAPSLTIGLVVITLVACGVTGGILLSGDTPTPNVDLREPQPAEPPVMRAQVLFTHQEPGRMTLDATVLDVPSDRLGMPAPGTPFSLEMRAPATEWFSASVGDLLAAWAERGEVVDVELVHDARGPRVRLARHEARILLDVTGAAGLPRRPRGTQAA